MIGVCRSIVLLSFVLFSLTAAAADKPLTNEDIVALVKAGFDDDTIITKINASGRSKIDTSAQALIALKSAGVSKRIIDATLTSPPPQGTASRPALGHSSSASASSQRSADVQLVTSSGTFELASIAGSPSATYIGIGFLTWLNFEEPNAAVRTKDRAFSILVRSKDKPSSRYFIVRVDVNDHDRSVKMGKASMFTASAPTTPDRGWTFAYDAEEQSEGLWRLSPRKPMMAGEYGLLFGSELYDFAVE